MDRAEIAQGCLEQAERAAKLGSPMYETLLRRLAKDVRDGGPCLAALDPHSARTRMLAPLLLLAAINRMVLEGRQASTEMIGRLPPCTQEASERMRDGSAPLTVGNPLVAER
jgi:hypothetical protein